MKKKLILLSLCVSIVLCSLKFLAFYITSSNAILTDALESIINVIAAAFAFYSIHLASQPKDFLHPYGHGKIEFFSAGFEGALIILAGFFMIYESIKNFLHPSEMSSLPIGILILAFTIIINGILGKKLQKLGKIMNSVTLVADGKHLVIDAVSNVILLVGVAAIYFTHFNQLDSILSIVFSLVILWNGFKMVRSSVAGLMDEADTNTLQTILNILITNRNPYWIDIHNLRVQHYGSDLHIDAHLTLPYYFTLEQTHEEVNSVKTYITKNTQRNVEIFIHADPCLPPENCMACSVLNCPVRKADFVKSYTWTIENISKDARHYTNG